MVKQNALRCDAMVVDSNSPMLPDIPPSVWCYRFEDNIGHLSRGGRDGWGRAFCYGLQYAMEYNYDYVAHVECDSLCKLDIAETADEMELRGDVAATIHVSSMPLWPETGFMFFEVDWLRTSRLVDRYDWANRTRYPEPERVIRDICGNDLQFMSWRGMRDDFHELTENNVEAKNLDWLTHAPLRVMERFAGATAPV